MSRLFIIGNGFDKAHCLPTDYSNFKEFVCKSESGGGVYTIIHNAEQKYNSYGNSSKEWSGFEELLQCIDLASYSPKEFCTLAESLEPGIDGEKFIGKKESDQIYFMNSLILNRINKLFNAWIGTINPKKGTINKCLDINKNDEFLNFNYTTTLEDLYDVDKEKINYLHRKDSNAKGYRYIFGFEEYEERMFKRNLCSVFNQAIREFIKPVNVLIQNGEVDYLNNIEEVYFWGFSLSTVDKPYIERIFNSHKETINTVKLCKYQFYNDREKYLELDALIKKCGLKSIELEYFDDCSNSIGCK
ncbi:bacteriophage abortive infection AbiH family protein [Tetragenococcus koreensis]|uniref:AbiH family protein n=1 Tax=Tetragenococcus koreensis TaxID=290335 RepID=UPI001F45A803|nr:AbiH family protein [Tetragenococcus koreensis]MCF1585811.1 bacteriophage abortive infection AbiH family protein [Tetragenococcus koreensis]MCF1630059.1 bacteriophage abortive infection AbiH family protein [Tetragenococcus koreensis]